MLKPAFVFDGRNILPHSHLMELGFRVEAIGKKVTLENKDYLQTGSSEILSPTSRVLPWNYTILEINQKFNKITVECQVKAALFCNNSNSTKMRQKNLTE